MPVNSFEHYPMNWRPERGRLGSPLFRSLAELLERDIQGGLLAAHTKLPPQRELADYLDVSLSTVTRAYSICEQRGLIYGITGSGTFVAPTESRSFTVVAARESEQVIDMGSVSSFPQFQREIGEALRALCAGLDFEGLSGYRVAGPDEAALLWLRRMGVEAAPEQVFVTAGAQNALAVALTSLFQAGDRIATDIHTYPNFKELARHLHIQLVPVEGDAQGMLPEHLQECCEGGRIKGIYLMPGCQNPTTAVLTQSRREALAEVIRRNRLTLLEDEVYGFLDSREGAERRTPLSALLPECGVYISSLSKVLSGGLRIAYLCCAQGQAGAIAAGLSGINLLTSPILGELAGQLIQNGTVDRLIEKKLRMLGEVNRHFDRQLLPQGEGGHPMPYYRWLPLPEQYHNLTGPQFEAVAKEYGIKLFHQDRFLVSKAPDAIPHCRVSLTSQDSFEGYQEGIARLQALLEGQQMPERGLVI